MNKIWIFALCGVVSVTSGCGVRIESTRIGSQGTDDIGIPSIVPGGGVVYALPKTEFEVAQPVTVKTSTAGALHDTYDSCQRACDAQATGPALDDACKFSKDPSVTFAQPELRLLSVPDRSHLYQVSADADMFETLSLKFDIASNGVIDKADSTISSNVYDVLSAVATTAIKVGGIGAMAMTTHLKGMKVSAGPRNCYEVSNETTLLVKKDQGELSCALQREIGICMQPFNDAVQKARDRHNGIFDDAAVKKIDSKLLEAIAINLSKRVDDALARRNEAAALYAMADGKSKEASYQIVLPAGSPADFQPFRKEFSLGSSVDKREATIVGVSENAGELLKYLSASVAGNTRTYTVTTAMPADIRVVNEATSADLGNGYKYRVPTQVPVSLTVFEDQTKNKKVVGPIIQKATVAQYGPIAALPSSFKGKGGHVVVKHWPDSGGLQSVEIGADSIPSSAITAPLEEAYTQYKAVKDKKAADAAKATAADPELDQLTRQQKILELKKEIKELEEALKP